jgi:HSP20 family protein
MHIVGVELERKAFSGEWSPSVDISVTEDKLLVYAELPGLEERDVNVGISGDLLTIRAEKKKEKEEKVPVSCWIKRSWINSFRGQRISCRTKYVRSAGE